MHEYFHYFHLVLRSLCYVIFFEEIELYFTQLIAFLKSGEKLKAKNQDIIE